MPEVGNVEVERQTALDIIVSTYTHVAHQFQER